MFLWSVVLSRCANSIAESVAESCLNTELLVPGRLIRGAMSGLERFDLRIPSPFPSPDIRLRVCVCIHVYVCMCVCVCDMRYKTVYERAGPMG